MTEKTKNTGLGAKTLSGREILTDGSPVSDDHRELKDNGQQKAYVILSEEERAKGYVRPVRMSYVHKGASPQHPTRPLTDKENKQYADFNYELYEEYPESESPISGRFWTSAQLNSGCGALTEMSQSIAETYARDPKFYSGTFCCGCGAHFALEQFIWDGTDEIVGS